MCDETLSLSLQTIGLLRGVHPTVHQVPSWFERHVKTGRSTKFLVETDTLQLDLTC
jgi:hypothetical protein